MIEIGQTVIEGFNVAGLYEIVTLTDLERGELKVLYPVWLRDDECVRDLARKTRYFSSVQMTVGGMTQQVSFEIEAETVVEAFEKFPARAEEAAKGFIEQMNKARAERKVIVPHGALPTTH